MSLDLYAETRTLIAALDAGQEGAWAERFRQCMEGGATGSEVVMALGWGRGPVPGGRGRGGGRGADCIDRIRQEAARLMA